jgi:hypothetical protein
VASLPVRLAIKMRLCDWLEGIQTADGYFSDVQRVFRGRMLIADEVPLPALALIDTPSPIWQSYAGDDKLMSWGNWQLFVQGWWAYDPDKFDNPCDDVDLLAADVALRLSMICAFDPKTGGGIYPEIYKLGLGGPALIDSIEIGPPVVRAPDGQQVTRAFFYMPIMITMSAELDKPYITV